MPWQKREQFSALERERIPGLNFLIGDLYSRQFRIRQFEGQKYATISFPSGLSREILTVPDTLESHVHVFGSLTLAVQRASQQNNLDIASAAKAHGYSYHQVNADRHLVWRPLSGEHFQLTYENNYLVDVARLQGEPGRATVPRPMELLDTESRALLLPLYANEPRGLQAVAPVKFFTPDSGWTWYPTEFDGNDLFFGLVSGLEVELGYFTLSELEEVRGPLGLPIERDLYFHPKTLAELQRLHDMRR
jgi:hypothetical protein